jgi:hypothetical protein
MKTKQIDSLTRHASHAIIALRLLAAINKMKISLEELNRRLTSEKNIVNTLPAKKSEKFSETPGRSPEKSKGNDSTNKNNCGRLPELPNAPKSLRVVAGVCARVDNGVIASNAFGLTPGQVRYAAKDQQTKLTEKQVQETALICLMDTLGLLTADRIADEKPKDISAIAANLSRVHSNLRPREDVSSNNVQVNIYTPKQRRVDEYDVIEVQTGT